MANEIPLKKLILVPALITLGITLLRLVGELMHWSPVLFNRAAGGRLALVGIAWLVPIFGVYFAIKLAAAGKAPSNLGLAIMYALLGVAIVPVLGFAATGVGVGRQSFAMFGVIIVASIAGAVGAAGAWPALGKVLLAYALAARIPVAIVMLIAMLGDWGTHYDVAPPDFPAMGVLSKWLLIGLLPQMTIWIWYTIALGALVGAIAVGIMRLVQRPATA
jgi:hypothetical protein